MVKIIALTVVVLVAAVLAYASTRPNTFRVERSIAIKAAPDRMFALIDDFHSWGWWSPYERLDPEMKKSYRGAPGGQGAVYEWQGNSRVGRGCMEIVESVPHSRVTIKLAFEKPFKTNNTAYFTLAPQAAWTKVTWAMEGSNRFIGKVMSVFMSMDDLLGKDFEVGLENLKTVAERDFA